MSQKCRTKAAFTQAALPDPSALRVYVQPWDFGMAPNITGGLCTLATCKPRIRQYTKLGREWILAVGAVRTLMNLNGPNRYEDWKHRLVYVMIPDERISYAQYFNDPRFANRIPQAPGDAGDNIYCPDGNGGYQSVAFVNDIHRATERLKPNPHFMVSDLLAPVALVAHQFWYWGDQAPHLHGTGMKPDTIDALVRVRREHIVIDDPAIIHDVAEWLRHQNPGIHGQPRQKHLLLNSGSK